MPTAYKADSLKKVNGCGCDCQSGIGSHLAIGAIVFPLSPVDSVIPAALPPA
jgi:hypothetical protein